MKTTLVWLALGMLVISNAVFAMLYFTKNDNAASVTTVANTTEEPAPTDVAAEEFPNMASQVATEATAERTSYDAVAANFELNISPNFQVIVEKDGGDGSLRSTILKIGRKGTDDSGAISLKTDDFVKIEAFPSDVNGTRDQFVTSDTALQGNSADEAASEIDGVQARKFTLEGVGRTVKYFFERDGITYFIESWDVSSGDTLSMLNNVVKGFSFN